MNVALRITFLTNLVSQFLQYRSGFNTRIMLGLRTVFA